LECYVKNHQFAKGPDVFHIPVCNYCTAYKYKNTWKNESFEHAVKRYINNAFSFDPDFKDIGIDLDCQKEEDSMFCKATVKGRIDNQEIAEDHFLEIRLKPNVCDVCSKRFGGYHEAILQIRTSKKKMSEKRKRKIELFIDQFVSSMQQRGNRKLFITDKNFEKTGIDYLLSDKQAAASIVKKTQEAFSGEITVSSSNIGMHDGKQVYRMTYLLRLPGFNTYDILSKEDSLFIITSLSGNLMHALDLKTWEDHTFKLKDFEKSTVFDYDELVQNMILVSQTEKEVQVMDKETYKIVVISKPKKIQYKSDQISVIRFHDALFILPQINDK
jgi:nonsense-mediated mRNA decay protein 3